MEIMFLGLLLMFMIIGGIYIGVFALAIFIVIALIFLVIGLTQKFIEWRDKQDIEK